MSKIPLPNAEQQLLLQNAAMNTHLLDRIPYSTLSSKKLVLFFNSIQVPKMSNPCENYKITLVDTVIVVQGTRMTMDSCDFAEEAEDTTPIHLAIKAYELNYGPVIDFTITSSVPFTNVMDWTDHPLMYVKKNHYDEKKSISEHIIDDTPAVRLLLQELAQKEPFKLYTTTDCTHRARLIQALENFWS